MAFITVSHNIFGNTAKYVELVCFQVSEPYRGKKIGKTLFYKACEEAKRLGSDKLYISAHSSRESQAVYKSDWLRTCGENQPEAGRRRTMRCTA